MRSHEFVSLLAIPKGQRLLGLDFGEKTIGVAISDSSWCIASPQENITHTNFRFVVESLKRLIHAYDVGGIVVGFPYHLNYSEGQTVQNVRSFVGRLKKEIGLPIIFWDERLSTHAVTRILRDEADLSRRKQNSLVDKVAAAYMLQGALNRIENYKNHTLEEDKVMITHLSHTTIYVFNQDEALEFYTKKLGFEVHTDAQMEGMRWLTVNVKGQKDVEIVLAEPKAGFMLDEESAAAIQTLLKKGVLGGGAFTTKDCRATYEELKARGVVFDYEPIERPYGIIETVFRDNSGNWFCLAQEHQH
jgi:putative transcription antitermination factor YqgF